MQLLFSEFSSLSIITSLASPDPSTRAELSWSDTSTFRFMNL